MANSIALVTDKVGLVAGVANDQSIAAGCARALRADGAKLALTYQNDKAKPFVVPVAEAVDAQLFLPLDLETEARSRPYLPPSKPSGVGSTSSCTRSLIVRRTICTEGSLTVRASGLRAPWTIRCTFCIVLAMVRAQLPNSQLGN
jgi:hypothetical protein